jgi:hypothetical protein
LNANDLYGFAVSDGLYFMPIINLDFLFFFLGLSTLSYGIYSDGIDVVG